MNRLTIIISVLALILIGAFIYIKNDIQKNISGEFDKVKLSNLQDFFVPKVDLNVDFNIINKSRFSFKLSSFKVRIFNSITSEFLTENIVEKELVVPIGVSSHNIVLEDSEILGNASDFLNGNVRFLAVISFRVFGIRVEFEQLLNL